jgi:hypothetical protein
VTIQVKTFESDVLATVEASVNTFLDTIPEKDVLDTLMSSYSSAKYGTAKTYVITVVYKVA